MIPLRATNLKYASEWPKHIILHHTAEFVANVPRFKFDTKKSQATSYLEYSRRILKKTSPQYHFIVDQTEKDYSIIVAQPILTLCEYDDIPKEYHSAIHVAFLGDYNEDFPPLRIYRVLAYRLLAPMMRLFYLDENDILFHSAISTDKSISCPGEFIDMTHIKNQLREVQRKRVVRRG